MPPTGDEVVAEDACLDGVLGFEVLSIGEEEAVARFPIADRVRQRFGLVHGGAYAALAEMLATEATALLHGREAADQAAETARRTFEEGALAESLPTIELPRAEFDAGLGVLTAFVRAGLVASTSEARRQIKGGGLKVNGDTVTSDGATLGSRDLVAGSIKLSLGRKKHVLLKPA